VGEASTYSFELWVVLLSALGAAVVAGAGWLLRRRQRAPGYLILLGGLWALFTVVPGIYLKYVKIDPEHVEWRTDSRQSIRFADLRGLIHYTKLMKNGRVHFFEFRKTSGETVRVQVGWSDQSFLTAAPEIFDGAKAKGVDVFWFH
jgi:LPXTG-motif cell wall-anchored protein